MSRNSRATAHASVLAPALLGALVACGPKFVGEAVFQSADKSVDVQLRRTLRGGEPVPRGYAHPALVSDVRMAHILAHLSFREGGGERPAIRSQHLYDLAAGLTQAFQAAGPDDEVIARAVSVDRRLQIFTQERVTAFQAFFDADFLYIEFFALEELIEEDPRRTRDERYAIPAELPQSRLPLVAGEARSQRGPRGLQIEWRNPLFQQPVSLALRGGQVRRRSVLLEAEPHELAPPPPPLGQVPPALREAQLRALDQLDSGRRAGQLTEAEFQRRRRLVLEGRLEEAGYDSVP